jgi:hypothetical protein
MSQPAALASFEQALARLSPNDEVSVFALRDWFVGEGQQLCPLTKDRLTAAKAMQASIAEALHVEESERNADRRTRDKSMSAAVERALQTAALRPDSHIALVYVSDGMNTLDTMEARDRKALAVRLQQRNISFSAMNLDMLNSYAAAAAVLNPLGKVFGLSVTGSARYLSQEAGGVSVEVPSPSEFGPSLEKVVSAYASRYSLGYQLSSEELRDGRNHKVEVTLTGNKASGKEILSRRNFVASAPETQGEQSLPAKNLP